MDPFNTQAQGGQDYLPTQGGQNNTLTQGNLYNAQGDQYYMQAQGGQDFAQAQGSQHYALAQSDQDNAQAQSDKDCAQSHGSQDKDQAQTNQDSIEELVNLMDNLDISRCITAKTYQQIVQGIRHKRITAHQFFKLSKSVPMELAYEGLEEVEGDLFTADPSWALAHCVSRDLAMFRGIAAVFKVKYGHVEDLIRQGAGVGYVAVLHHVGLEDVEHIGRFIFYMITKQRFFHKPSYLQVYCALQRMKTICSELNITKIAMPRISTGCDRLNFDIIKHILLLVFRNSGITIRIYNRT